MGELPAGTITMLFSEIEGSTALLRRLGDRYADALSAQRSLLRTAFADCGGQEMGTRKPGDRRPHECRTPRAVSGHAGGPSPAPLHPHRPARQAAHPRTRAIPGRGTLSVAPASPRPPPSSAAGTNREFPGPGYARSPDGWWHQVRPGARTRSSGMASRGPAMRGRCGRARSRVLHGPRVPRT